MNIPMALEPASPIKSLLGVALYAADIRADILQIIKYNSSKLSVILSTESSTKKVIMVMMVSVPERPSTPSEQFVTLIDTLD